LHFTLLETIVIAVTVVILAIVSQDGESNWMEGIAMLAVYGIIALAFFNMG
jgi:Ca2+:H+ antiporter